MADFPQLVAQVERDCERAASSRLHGSPHWRDVSRVALALAIHEPGVDLAVGLRFGLLHDAKRLHDGDDAEHGPRASEYVWQLHHLGVLGLDREQTLTLASAVAHHTTAMPTHKAPKKSLVVPRKFSTTETVCFDADRLTLHRVGIEPSADFLFTDTARLPDAPEWSRALLSGSDRSWSQILSDYIHRRPDTPLPVAVARTA
jgi:uncharacterized protein